ncbi:hypothetical protein BDF14DRAFT_1045053 [Spinellus fusiger]|nr:hypothetical protein BDF14DRAFT_1045053 [Spinellus fusiger]
MLEASHSPPPPPPPPPPPIRLPQVIPPIRTTSRLPQHTHSHHRSSTLTAPPALTSSYLMRQQLYSQASNETCYSFSSSTAVPEAVELSTSSSSSSIDSVSSVDMAVYVPPLYNSLFSGMGTSPHFIKEYRKGKGRLRCSEDPPTYSPSPLVRQKMSSGWIPFAHLPRHKKSIPRWLDPLCTQTSVCLSLDDQETHSRTLYRK